jgi:hypothetical protein
MTRNLKKNNDRLEDEDDDIKMERQLVASMDLTVFDE